MSERELTDFEMLAAWQVAAVQIQQRQQAREGAPMAVGPLDWAKALSAAAVVVAQTTDLLAGPAVDTGNWALDAMTGGTSGGAPLALRVGIGDDGQQTWRLVMDD